MMAEEVLFVLAVGGYVLAVPVFLAWRFGDRRAAKVVWQAECRMCALPVRAGWHAYRRRVLAKQQLGYRSSRTRSACRAVLRIALGKPRPYYYRVNSRRIQRMEW